MLMFSKYLQKLFMKGQEFESIIQEQLHANAAFHVAHVSLFGAGSGGNSYIHLWMACNHTS